MMLMLSATFTGIILTHFETALAAVPVLTSYIPMLSGTGGNSGTQASTAVIRALSLGEVRFGDLLRVVWKECRVALICGACLAAANFVKMMLVDCWLLNNPAVTPWVAAVVCATLVGTVACAKLVGSGLPILAEKIGFDPAVMASPLHHHHRGRYVPADLLPVRHLDPGGIDPLRPDRLKRRAAQTERPALHNPSAPAHTRGRRKPTSFTQEDHR